MHKKPATSRQEARDSRQSANQRAKIEELSYRYTLHVVENHELAFRRPRVPSASV
ncbi:hypothetical protein THAOC_21379, partial [Thalassiosira oceanica]